jgi:hypothetical protein
LVEHHTRRIEEIKGGSLQRRYQRRARLEELATERIIEFAGDPEGQRLTGAQLTGNCSFCGKALIDPISLERGIGPECIKLLRAA